MPEGGVELSERDMEMAKGTKAESRAEQQPAERPQAFENALKGLRKRLKDKEKPIEIRDGNVLIQAAITDLQAGKEEPDTELLDDLRKVDAELLDLAYGGAQSLTFEQINHLRGHFKGNRAMWNELSKTNADPAVAETRDVYTELSTAINKDLPTPEAVFPDYPEYDLAGMEALLQQLPDEVTLPTIGKFYDEILLEDVSGEEKKLSDGSQKQRETIHQATQKWQVKEDADKPILVTVNNDSSLANVTVVNNLKDKPPEENGKSTKYFILDPKVDLDFLNKINGFDTLAKYKNSEESPIVFMRLLEEGILTGKISKKYIGLREKLVSLLNEKIKEIGDSEEKETEDTRVPAAAQG